MTRAEMKRKSKGIIKEHTGSLILGSFLYLLLPIIIIGILQFIKNTTVINGGSTAAVSLLKLIMEAVAIFTSISFIKLCARTIKENREIGLGESLVSMKGFGKFILIKIILGILLGICIFIVVIIGSFSLIGSIAATNGDYYSMLSLVANFIVGILVFAIFAVIISFIVEIFLMSIPYLIIEREDLGPWDVFAKSVSIGAKNFGALFVLNLSYIGWLCLVVVTCGIALLWVGPYMTLTNYQMIGQLSDNYFRGYEGLEENLMNDGIDSSIKNGFNDNIVIFDAEVYTDEVKSDENIIVKDGNDEISTEHIKSGEDNSEIK